MRLRLSTAIGLPVVDESEQILGKIADICINPDTLNIEGFFVHIQGFFSSEIKFLQCIAIEHWGSRIRVRHADSLSPIEELVRISRILEDQRPVMRQMMVTDFGKKMGRCTDIQFDTRSFRLEWLFPRRFLRWGIPIPIRAIVEIKRDAIVIQTKERLPLQDQVSEDISVIEAVISTPAV